MNGSNVLNFSLGTTNTKKEKVTNHINQAKCQIFHILDLNKKFNYLILKIKKDYPDFNIKSFKDIENYIIDSENNQFIFMYNGTYVFINMGEINEMDLLKQARELEDIGDFIDNYGNIILSWFSTFNMQILLNVNNFYINESDSLINFTLWGQKYTCPLNKNIKPQLKIV